MYADWPQPIPDGEIYVTYPHPKVHTEKGNMNWPSNETRNTHECEKLRHSY